MDDFARPRVAGDRIRLTGVRATGFHGVFPEERRDGQEFVADVVLHVDTRDAAATDRLDLTVDYGDLAAGVAQILAGVPADLIETVAERIAAHALSYSAVEAVDVVVHKPTAPITVPFTDVTVEVHRDRAHPPVVPAPALRHAAVPVEDAHDAGAYEGLEPTTGSQPEAVRDSGAHVAAPAVPAPVALLGPLDMSSAATQLFPVDPAPAAPPVPQLVPIDDLDPDRADRLDDPPGEPVDVVLALGSNLGSSQEILRRAIGDLAALPGVDVTGIAPLARTGAVGGPDQPDFLNTVVLATCTLSPRDLLHACQRIEEAHGRVRGERWGARTLDIDLICFGSVLAVTDDLELPHPRACARAFVLEPWAQVDPDAVLPGLGGGPVAQLATTAPDRDGIRWLALDWWSSPEVG